MTQEQLAIIAHYVNMGVCVAYGDHSQFPWEKVLPDQRQSALNGVANHLAASHLLSGEQSHRLWMTNKIGDGWTYGPVKDPVLKQHPDLVDYSRLSEAGRVKDCAFSGIIEALRSFVTE